MNPALSLLAARPAAGAVIGAGGDPVLPKPFLCEPSRFLNKG